MFMKHFEKVKADLGLEYEVAYGYAEINKEGGIILLLSVTSRKKP